MSLLLNDPVHGHIMLHPLCLKIIDTAEFQRLRDIKQTGTACWVFTSTRHSRFEHCIGVAHLAYHLGSILQKNQPELGITEQELLCVQLTGLCHDLGHGPYSHLFEDFLEGEGIHIKHEHMSYYILEHIMDKYSLRSEFYKYGLNGGHIKMIGEMIFGSEAKSPPEWPWVGPPPSKEFLYEIVSNEETGIDVDKFDYYRRDCMNAHITSSFDSNRLMLLTRALPVRTNDNVEIRLCYPMKEYWNVCELFRTRYLLHTRIYTHKTVAAVDLLLIDFFKAISKIPLPIAGADGACLAEVNEKAIPFYTSLTDSFVYLSKLDCFQKDSRIKALSHCIDERRLPKIIKDLDESEERDDIRNVTSHISYGKGEKNPMHYVHFYDSKGLVVNGREVEDELGAVITPPFSIQKRRFYRTPY